MTHSVRKTLYRPTTQENGEQTWAPLLLTMPLLLTVPLLLMAPLVLMAPLCGCATAVAPLCVDPLDPRPGSMCVMQT